MNIILIGFRGTGKTAAGKKLAERLGNKFIDVDDLIEKRHCFSINELFQHRGEPLFRLLESDIINEISKLDSRVIAAGGGAVMKYKNVKNLKRRGILILLEADSDTICKRILADAKTSTQRPALTEHDLYQEIKELLDFRRYYYHRAADYVVHTSKKNIETVTDEIMNVLRQDGFVPL